MRSWGPSRRKTRSSISAGNSPAPVSLAASRLDKVILSFLEVENLKLLRASEREMIDMLPVVGSGDM